jgi:hypothetical protein
MRESGVCRADCCVFISSRPEPWVSVASVRGGRTCVKLVVFFVNPSMLPGVFLTEPTPHLHPPELSR